jgi:hypothetical protein
MLYSNRRHTDPGAFTTTLLILVSGICTSFGSHAAFVTTIGFGRSLIYLDTLDNGRDDVCYHLIDIVWISGIGGSSDDGAGKGSIS